MSAWEGDCAIEGIAATDALQAALDLAARALGFARIRVRVPWHALRTEAVQILVEGLVLNVLAEPHDPSAAADPVLPLTALAAAVSTGATAATPKSTVDVYVERFAALLMQNVAVTLERVYVLYQDEQLAPPLCAALARRALARAADANWRPAFVDANTWRRRAELRGLSVGFRRLPNAADARPDGRAAAATPRPSPRRTRARAGACARAAGRRGGRRAERDRAKSPSPMPPSPATPVAADPRPAAARASGARRRLVPPSGRGRRGGHGGGRVVAVGAAGGAGDDQRDERCCGGATRRCWCRRAAAARGSCGAGCRFWRCV